MGYISGSPFYKCLPPKKISIVKSREFSILKPSFYYMFVKGYIHVEILQLRFNIFDWNLSEWAFLGY